MPVKELTQLLQPEEAEVIRIAGALPYRDFMTRRRSPPAHAWRHAPG